MTTLIAAFLAVATVLPIVPECPIEDRSARGDCPGQPPSSGFVGGDIVEGPEGWDFVTDPVTVESAVVVVQLAPVVQHVATSRPVPVVTVHWPRGIWTS